MNSKSSSPKAKKRTLTYQGTFWEPRYGRNIGSDRKKSRSSRPVVNTRGKRTLQANLLTNTKRVRTENTQTSNFRNLVRENYFRGPPKSSNYLRILVRENHFRNPITMNQLVRQIVEMSLNNTK